ncbi:glycosyltransferase family 2 protein [Brachybacterium saurashtrense]|uniref:Glycosyltransferase family 2 protein n=2 Tax=Brachybacterium saurashtrense TaxID=556288 RepID=A0A345YTG2_9MICO|nr:glycosyltransferase [Brachybacterium saurashtrense]AXK47214.1 glycosyltransferase family 2 protein [Brachybacterium saurashtrense]RRR21206.1 glycosyltransferase family 2 protein [Brachybacterium saurashtrense]
MPLSATPDVIPLYLESHAARSGAHTAAFGLGSAQEESHDAAAAGASHQAAYAGQPRIDELSTRYGVRVPEQSLRSFGTYFNAFPASYWRRWTPVRQVNLAVTTSGAGQIIVYRSNARGAIQRHDMATVTGDGTTLFELPLTAFGDGGWYWFDVITGDAPLTILGAQWTADSSAARTEGTFSIAMTTMNKVSYVLDNIALLSRDPDLREKLDVMYVVDQGSDRLSDHAELAPLQEAMGDQLRIIEQGNIGGSGGFSRGMYEASTNGSSTYVINTDDDIDIEPESLLRMITFADYTRTPMLVGAHMFDLNNRSVLHAFGESVDPWAIQPRVTIPESTLGHDFAAEPLRSTPWLHRRADVDYNGWWTCLIPTETVREIGLSLPVFIKWDDAEYGLRAKKAGYPTVSLPGAAVWHITWTDKNDALDWQIYFHERNRIITALLHSGYERGGRVLTESQSIDVKHLLSMQYYTQAARLYAQTDVLRGPDVLHGEIGTKLPELRQMAQEHDDSVTRPDPDSFPDVQVTKPPRKGKPFSAPHRALLPLWTVKAMGRQLLASPPERARRHPQAQVAHQDAKWWTLSHYDSAVVSNAEGTKVAWYQRRPEQVRAMLTRSARTHLDLYRQWNRLRDQYRAAAEEITSFPAWERTFAANPAPARPGIDDRDGSGESSDETAESAPA